MRRTGRRARVRPGPCLQPPWTSMPAGGGAHTPAYRTAARLVERLSHVIATGVPPLRARRAAYLGVADNGSRLLPSSLRDVPQPIILSSQNIHAALRLYFAPFLAVCRRSERGRALHVMLFFENLM